MKGLELARGYYEEFGKPMLENEFEDVLPYLCVGFVGSGSEHYGFDDLISQDHDIEPGFCIFLPGEDVVDRKRAFALERAYAKLPKEYGGMKRGLMSPVGGNRNGVIRIEDFYSAAVGAPDGNLSAEPWLHIPDYALADATNGEIFFDNYGLFTEICERIKAMPADIKYKRLAGNLLVMAQSGQYNFTRCLSHGEPEAAQLALNEYVSATLKVLFLLNDRYMPYYKWSFRALRELPDGDWYAEKLSILLRGDNRDDNVTEEKYLTVEEIASKIISILIDRKMTEAICGDLEKHAYSVNDRVSDGVIRNMHILAAV